MRLLETLVLHPGHPRHFPQHLRRMLGSAVTLGFDVTEQAIRDAVAAAAATHPTGSWRLRILADRRGTVEVEVHELQPPPSRLTAALSTLPIPSDHPLIRHKTTERSHFAERMVPGYDETLLINERGELTEFTYGNLGVERDGAMLTPPVRCGLLPGVERELSLRSGSLAEQILRVEDLASADGIWHFNGVRGWTPVDLVLTPSQDTPSPR